MRSVLARRFVRWTIRIAAILAIIFVALIIAAIALERRIGELVIRRGLEAINMRLRVPVSPQGVEFTFFANFPQASIHLRDVYIPGAWPSGERGTDTLLVAQSVFLVLNPIDLLLGEYRIEQFKVVRGVLNLRKNAQGQTNYNLLSDRQPEEQLAKEASLQLHNVRLQQMLVDFKDDTKQLYARGTVESLVAKGRFAKGASNLSLRAEGLVDYLKQGSFLYAQRQGFSLKAQIAQQGDLIAILESKLAIDRNRFSLMGSVNYATGDTDISAQGESIDLRAALAFASQFHIQLPPTLAVDGRLNASLELKGTMGTGKKILILMAISGKDLTLNYEGKKYRLVRFRGEFNNGKAASPTWILASVGKTLKSPSRCSMVSPQYLQSFSLILPVAPWHIAHTSNRFFWVRLVSCARSALAPTPTIAMARTNSLIRAPLTLASIVHCALLLRASDDMKRFAFTPMATLAPFTCPVMAPFTRSSSMMVSAPVRPRSERESVGCRSILSKVASMCRRGFSICCGPRESSLLRVVTSSALACRSL